MANGTVSKDTKITAGFALTLLISFIGGTFWLKDELSSINTNGLLMDVRLQSIERSVDTKYAYLEGYVDKELGTLKQEFNKISHDRIYRHEFLSWLKLLEAENPSIVVPEVEP